MRISLQPAYVLHSRAYRDSSQLLEVFSAEHGRLSLVAKGARRRRHGGSDAAILQPFIPLLLSFVGRGELQTLTACECAGDSIRLRGQRLFSGFYLNELLMRLLHRHDAHPTLFAQYGDTLCELAGGGAADEALRRFEGVLLQELGYDFDFAVDAASGSAVSAQCRYQYLQERGMVAVTAASGGEAPLFAGADLAALARGERDERLRQIEKHLMRTVLAAHLGPEPLRSRALFRSAPSAPNNVPDRGEQP